MSTSKQSESQSSTQQLPPVLASLPWLERPSAEASTQTAVIEPPQAFDATFFQPHQLLATPDQPLETPDPSPTMVRFDPPQPAHSATPAQEPSQPAEPDSPEEARAVARAVVQPSESREGDGVTQLRFDPPVGGAPQAAPAVATESVPEPSAWHQTIAAMDNTIRQYHRIIMLVALLTAAGLMMLVLESQQAESIPAGEAVTPAAINTEAMQPLPLAEACNAPAAVPESIAVAKGPQDVSRQLQAEVAPLTPELSVAAQPADPQPEELDLPAADQIVESADEGGYPDTCKPEFTFGNTEHTVAAPPQARLSKELKPANQQIR
ncbi:hypothetical protein NG895_19900 [Aeoliella sp. ICT_H6.2]|uniref:Uncharacterized protein n=1 Tax=Aeoliella straminimaris TaxID=2954799 RepID=A0A9X2FC33_9BACT|nr:hypothetical protein [Aeoliella straminimaris]MCO6046170.1 hypothetical protein [Aeoliella straminimaris]